MKTPLITDPRQLATQARLVRLGVLDMVTKVGMGHTGSSLSCADILTTLYFGVLAGDPQAPKWPARDRFVLSKGHAVEGYAVILSMLGYFDAALLDTFCQNGGALLGHPSSKIPGMEANTGALGHGLSLGVGMALAGRMDKAGYRTFVLMGDGEQAEGSVWEAAMAAAQYKLGSLTAIIDRNRLQISGGTEEVMALEPFADKWRAFGWHVVEADGHDHAALLDALHTQMPEQPMVVIAHTVKGKGVPYMENAAHWHHGVPDAAQYEEALQALGGERRG